MIMYSKTNQSIQCFFLVKNLYNIVNRHAENWKKCIENEQKKTKSVQKIFFLKPLIFYKDIYRIKKTRATVNTN